MESTRDDRGSWYRRKRRLPCSTGAGEARLVKRVNAAAQNRSVADSTTQATRFLSTKNIDQYEFLLRR